MLHGVTGSISFDSCSGITPATTTAISPARVDIPAIPAELWTLPDPSGMRYLYVGGQVVNQGARDTNFLSTSPAFFGAERLVLLASGTIRRMSLAEIRRSLPIERP